MNTATKTRMILKTTVPFYIGPAVCLLFLLISLKSYAQAIPFQLTSAGHILVKATVEGQEGNFIFDTGGGINLFFTDFAKNLKDKQSYNFFTAFRATGERIDAPLFYSENLDFGNKKFNKTPYSTFDMKLPGINGLISLQMFQETDIIIDYKNKVIILENIDSIKNKKSFDIQLSTFADNALDIFTYVLLDNKYRIKVLLDSGAGNNSFWLSDKFVDLLGVDTNKFDVTEKKSEFNEKVTTKIYKGSIQSISNEFSKVEQPYVNFVEGLIYEGKTSINWLGSKIGISLKNKKMYILD